MSDAIRPRLAAVRGRLARSMANRAAARTAIVGTGTGIAVLATLGVLATSVTSDATSEVRKAQAITRVWNEMSFQVNAEDAALRQYLATGGTEYRRAQLAVTMNSARPELDWLNDNKSIERIELDAIRGAYDNYSRIVVDIVTMVSRGANVQGYADLASQIFAPLRDQVLDNVRSNEHELAQYLSRIDHRTVELRTIAAIMIPFCALLFSICAMVLLGYQRRAERQSATRLHEATHDPLTGLGNRTMMRKRLQTAVQDSKAGGEPFCLMLIDLDRFKEVNDTLGHHCGDELLVGVAKRLVAAVRNCDEAVRLGGDEFALVLPNVSDREAALEAAGRVLRELRQPMDLQGVVVDIDASIGVALYPSDSDDTDRLLQLADVAMYAAKRVHAGVVAYDPDLDDNSPNKLRLSM